MLVVMGEMLNTSVGSLFAAATLPGLVLSGLYLAYILGFAILVPNAAPKRAPGWEPQTRAAFWQEIWRGLFPMAFLIVVVLGCIFAGWATATESAGFGVVGALVLAWFNKTLKVKMLREAIREAAKANAMVFTLFLGATGFSYVFRAIGGDDVVMQVLVRMGIDTNWEILMFVMVLIFLLGFPFEWIEICLIVLPIFVPILVKLDFSDHLGDKSYFMPWFATLVAVNLQTSFMTPPFGATLFYMKGTVPPGVTMGDVYKAMWPFVFLQITGLALCLAFPGLVLWRPKWAGLLD